ncbi:hypothetical protein BCR42DRAFT_179113, partial [Absidia repens]
NQWTVVPQNPSTTCGRFQHTATLAPTTNTIYIIGGKCRRPSGVANGANMLEIHSYDTIQSSWLISQATTDNAQAIAPRAKHTTTLISGTNSFLIYGGEGADNPNVTIVSDYAYLYDFDKSVFTQLSLDSDVGAGPRTAHNAVAYKSYVMIMFGFNSQSEMLNDLRVLNATDLSALYWLGDSPPTDGSSVPRPGSNSSLSTGATAGIAVAAAVVGIGLTAALIYIVYRKRKQRKAFILEHTDPRRHPLGHDNPAYVLAGENDNDDAYPMNSTDVATTTAVDSIKPTETEEKTKPFGGS